MEEEEEAIMSKDEEKKRRRKRRNLPVSEDQDDYFVRYIPPAKSDLIGV